MKSSPQLQSTWKNKYGNNCAGKNCHADTQRLEIPSPTTGRFSVGDEQDAENRAKHGNPNERSFSQRGQHFAILPGPQAAITRRSTINHRVAEYTLISAILWLSVIALIGVNGYFGMARVEAAYRIERV